MAQNTYIHKIKYSRLQKGMSLLEVTVAMLVIGLGMAMSIAMIQTSVRSSISAGNQNTARVLLESISDRMRINRFAASAYRFGDTDSATDNNGGEINLLAGSWSKPDESTLKSNNPHPPCTSCTDKQKRDREEAFKQGYSDTINWITNVEESLPDARAAILELPGSDRRYRAVIQWRNVPDRDIATTADIPTQEASLVFTL